MATVAATIIPQGCGKGQNCDSSPAHMVQTTTLHKLNRVARSGSACRHYRSTGNKKAKYARKPFSKGWPSTLMLPSKAKRPSMNEPL